MVGEISGFVIFIMVVSFYMGVCLYINGMVADMRTNLTDSTVQSKQTNAEHTAIRWPIILKEIDFHNEIRT